MYYACSVKNRFVELDNIVISDEIEKTKTNPISSLKEIKGSPKIKQVKTKVPPIGNRILKIQIHIQVDPMRPKVHQNRSKQKYHPENKMQRLVAKIRP